MPSRVKIPVWRYRLQAGFTLIEMMISVVVTGLAIAMASVLAINYLRTTDSAIWINQARQDSSSIGRLLRAEVNEACLVGQDTTPITSVTSATPTNTPCTPYNACSSSAVTTVDHTLSLLLPITLPNGTVSYRVITYSRNATNLTRLGPPIASDGTLDVTSSSTNISTTIVDTLVNSTAAFQPTVSTDCSRTTISMLLNVPNTTGNNTIAQTNTYAVSPSYTKPL